MTIPYANPFSTPKKALHHHPYDNTEQLKEVLEEYIDFSIVELGPRLPQSFDKRKAPGFHSDFTGLESGDLSNGVP